MDSILIVCTSCSSRLKVPGSMPAGKRVKCPKCGVAVSVASAAGNGAGHTTAHEPAPTAPAPRKAAGSTTKSCPYCGEQILSSAVKCRHCGEFIEAEQASASARRRASSATASEDELSPAEYLVALLGAPIGLLIGLFWASRKQAKAKNMLQASGLVCVIGLVGGLLYWSYFVKKGPELPTAPTAAATKKFEEGGTKCETCKTVQFGLDYKCPRCKAWLCSTCYEQMPASASHCPRCGQNICSQCGKQVMAEHKQCLFCGTPMKQAAQGDDGELTAPSPDVLASQAPEIQRALKATVCIISQRSLGTGVVIQREGNNAVVITNRHVVDPVFAAASGHYQMSVKDLPDPTVKFVTNEKQSGKVVWVAEEIDLALLRVQCPQGIEVVSWQDNPEIQLGDQVFAVGMPAGLGWSAAFGKVSAFREHEYGNRKVPVVQTDTRIGPGNSGGGLFTQKGELVGINTFVVSSSHGTAGETGLGFAIRKSVLKDLKPELLHAAVVGGSP